MASTKGGPRVETSVSGVDTGLSSDTEIDTTIAAQPWITGYWKRLPALALLSLIVTLLSAAACVIVLALSDGTNVQDWKVSPAVLIGIFTSVGNAALTYALGEGFRIAWWTRATGKSNAISRLHAYYTHGTSAVSAGLSFKKPSLIALASVLAGIMAIDSPLLQRASSTELVVREDVSIPVSMTLATQLPFGFTGMEFAGDSEAIASRPLLNPSFAQVFRAYSEKEPIRVASALGCQGVCDGEIEAAGLWKSCDPADEKVFENSTQLLQKQLFTVGWSHETGRYRPTNYLSQGYMSVSEGMDDSLPNDEPYILLEMDYSPKPVNSSQARRSIFHKTCRLYSATSRYKIRIHNDTTTTTPQDSESPSSITSSSSSDNSRGNSITLTAPPTFIPGTVQNLRRSVANTNLPLTIPNPRNNTDTTPYILKISQPVAFFDGPGCQGSDLALTSMCPRLHETLGGLVSVAQDILSGNVTTPRPEFVSITGTLANQLISPLPVDGDQSNDAMLKQVGWDDPSEHIFSVLDELMFRLAINSSQNDGLERARWLYHGPTGDVWPAPTRDNDKTGQYKLLPVEQTVQMRQRRTVQVYVSHYGYLTGGVAVMLAAVAGLLPLFYGFWALGRTTSMSPVEMARAFGAPVLAGVGGSNCTAEEIAASKGGREVVVRYGEVVEGVRLGFGLAGRVGDPVSGRVYG